MSRFISAAVRFFLTGVAALLPAVVTVFVVTWVVKLADAYIGPSSSFGKFLLTIVGDEQKYAGYLVGYFVVMLLIMLLGFLVTRATVARLRRAIDRMLARIPLIGKIYTTVGQAVELFGNKDQSGLERFGGVGQVKAGNIKLVCLLTSNHRYVMADGREHFLVFILNSPIPATGFNIFVPVEDFQRLEMPVEDLAKLCMSLGLLGQQVLDKPLTLNGGTEEAHER